MPATAKMRRAKPKKRVGPKQLASSRSKAPDSEAARRVSTDDNCTRGEKIRLAEALRQEGIDERTIARGYASTHNKLNKSTDKGDIKLFVDVLKENTRILEPPRAADRNGADDGPVTVILRHNIPDPVR